MDINIGQVVALGALAVGFVLYSRVSELKPVASVHQSESDPDEQLHASLHRRTMFGSRDEFRQHHARGLVY